MRDGKANQYNNNLLTGEEIIGELLHEDKALLYFTTSPYGCWGPMVLPSIAILLGNNSTSSKMTGATPPIPNPDPFGMHIGRRRNPNSNISLLVICTPALCHNNMHCNRLVLAIVNTTALHNQDAKQGTLVPPTDPIDEDFVCQ